MNLAKKITAPLPQGILLTLYNLINSVYSIKCNVLHSEAVTVLDSDGKNIGKALFLKMNTDSKFNNNR